MEPTPNSPSRAIGQKMGNTTCLDSCFAVLDDACLRVGNALMERQWRVSSEGFLCPVSLDDRTSGTPWLEDTPEPTPILPEGSLPVESRTLKLEVVRGKRFPTEAESLVATLTAKGEQVVLVTVFQVFSDLSAISMQLTSTGGVIETMAAAADTGGHPTGIETTPTVETAAVMTDVVDSLVLAPRHLRLTAVTLRDQTDHHDELISEEELLLHPNKNRRDFDGVLFAVEEPLTGNGLVLVKEAPLPHACPVPAGPALQVRGHTCTVRGHGTGGDGLPGYRFTVLSFSGGDAGRTAIMHRWQRCLRQYRPERDGLLLTNTWGDRSQDSRINEVFMMEEIEASARLGADVVQIDDGWQKGQTANSVSAGGVWESFWAQDERFWDVHPERFPRGLEPLMDRARELGMKFGLWFAPDSAQDFTNWRRDSDRILDLHRSLGVVYFKIDGVKATTKQGERNLRRFFDRVQDETDGAVVFDLDVTAEIRPGYFGMVNVGPLFVENRYTDWFNYWPHRTLRNFWQLARWIDPVRLRMEFLNNARNTESYIGDPLAPAAWSPACLFATVFFSSPLGWFEVSGLDDSYVSQVSELIAVRRAHAETLFTGTILPIGSIPDGASWTGFQSTDADHTGVTVLVFRELAASADWFLQLDEAFDDKSVALEVLAGHGTAQAVDGGIRCAIPEKLGFLLVRVI